MRRIGSVVLRFTVGFVVLGFAVGLMGQVLRSPGPAAPAGPASEVTKPASSVQVTQRERQAVTPSIEREMRERKAAGDVLIAQAQEVVRARLRDPWSAQFSDVFVSRRYDRAPVACGRVNARNGFGGYTGPLHFVSGGTHATTFTEEGVEDFGRAWDKLCLGREPAEPRKGQLVKDAKRGSPLAVPTDPAARYAVLKIERRGAGLVSITTRREGPSGTSYARRLVDCGRQVFKYTAEGDTLDELETSRTSDPMGQLVAGSISYYVAEFACRTGSSR